MKLKTTKSSTKSTTKKVSANTKDENKLSDLDLKEKKVSANTKDENKLSDLDLKEKKVSAKKKVENKLSDLELKEIKVSAKSNLEKLHSDLGLKEKKNPKKKTTTDSSERKKVLKLIVTELEEKKCDDIVVINLEKVNSYLSIFIICTVNSSLQAKSVARELERKTKHLKLGTGSLEKKNSPAESGWSILDLGEIILHVMTKEVRSYYDLDKLWGDADRIKI